MLRSACYKDIIYSDGAPVNILSLFIDQSQNLYLQRLLPDSIDAIGDLIKVYANSVTDR